MKAAADDEHVAVIALRESSTTRGTLREAHTDAGADAPPDSAAQQANLRSQLVTHGTVPHRPRHADGYIARATQCTASSNAGGSEGDTQRWLVIDTE